MRIIELILQGSVDKIKDRTYLALEEIKAPKDDICSFEEEYDDLTDDDSRHKLCEVILLKHGFYHYKT